MVVTFFRISGVGFGGLFIEKYTFWVFTESGILFDTISTTLYVECIHYHRNLTNVDMVYEDFMESFFLGGPRPATAATTRGEAHSGYRFALALRRL